ncbi:hypothetical protein Pmani_012226 [Petrolisthes manimaculis]|uniref:Uncharacterized protein n=1 Tax=Petrolisthes manimaculis TaxID=1843537 RepID=A0AAE1PXT7_9EUCA|nr:hypothetical protein Pmani_012226 [Petrolisthes manimaculis]
MEESVDEEEVDEEGGVMKWWWMRKMEKSYSSQPLNATTFSLPFSSTIFIYPPHLPQAPATFLIDPHRPHSQTSLPIHSSNDPSLRQSRPPSLHPLL